MYENLLKLIQQAETADRIGKIENVVGMSMEASGGRSGIGDIVMIYNEAENCQVPAGSQREVLSAIPDAVCRYRWETS